MDKKLRDELTSRERELLAMTWENVDLRKALIKLAGLKNLKVAQMALEQSPSHEYTLLQRGFGQGVNWFPEILDTIQQQWKKDHK